MALIPVANMEASDRPCFEGVYEPVSRADAIVNCLDLPAINQFYAQLRSTNVIRETATTIRTGGGLNGVRFPSVNATISTKIQARPGVNSLAHAQIVQYRQAHALPLYDQYNINVGHLIWRKRHVNVAGQPRKVMQTVELSHHAEAYHSDAFFAALNVTANQRATSKVEVAEMEVAAINESRKFCGLLSLMWRKPTGEIIPEDDISTYTGPTMCWHGQLGGTPCYGPLPVEFHAPTGTTPSKRKPTFNSPQARARGGKAGRGGRKPGGGRGGGGGREGGGKKIKV